uniref:LIM zinc-binding domain-containing protein n=1 Tax=Romanomermis culicivorax TaxID=13658 RepID=A0A915K654_ROMCU
MQSTERNRMKRKILFHSIPFDVTVDRFPQNSSYPFRPEDGTPLDQFIASGKLLLCARCCEVRNPTKCAFCAKPFPKFDMSPGPQNAAYYCKGCFACASCTTKLKQGDKMFELSGKLFCANCEAKYQEAKYAVERMKTGP